MKTSVINLKIDPKTKKQAQKIADNLGLSLSTVIAAYLKQFVRTQSVFFSIKNEVPSPYLIKTIKKAEKERKKGKVYSFKNNKEAISFLDKQ